MYNSTFYNVYLVIIFFNIKFAVDKIKQNMPISSTSNLITHPNHILTKISIILGMLILFCLTPAVAHIVGDNGATNIQGDKMIAYPGGKAFFFRLYLSDKHNTPYSLDNPSEFLSPKAITRRNRQQLCIDSTDIPVVKQYIDAIANSGLQVVGTSRWHNTVLVRTKDADIQSITASLPFITKSELVFTTPDSILPTHRKTYHESLLPTPLVNNKSTFYGAADMQISAINGKQLHAKGFRGKGMTIAILDGGFMNVDRIPSLKNANIICKRNFVADGCKDVCNEIDHGTKVLSTMATCEPNVFVGTAPAARYLLLRSEDYNTESRVEEDYWTMAAEYADSMGVDIINSSLGYHHYDNDTPSTAYCYSQLDGKTTFISQSASMLARKGIILVNSAGNEGIGTWKKINFPADATDILSVGAIRPDSVNAAFSSIGNTADGRIKPDVMAPGAPAAVITGKGSISEDMGTSFAAPIVCGMVACLWQANPTKTATEIISIVRNSASQSASPDNIFGYGIANFGIKKK